MYNKKKGVEMEYLFLLFGLILLVIIAGAWQSQAMKIAQGRMSELKILTLTQVKDILLSMQNAPVKTQACASLINCKKLILHQNYIEIWGPENSYYGEEPYLSTSLVGDARLYVPHNESCAYSEDPNCWDPLNNFTTTCGTKDKPVYLCFEKVEEDRIYIIGHI